MQEMRIGLTGRNTRQGGLADPGGAPEDHRMQLPALDRLAQWLSRSQDVLLAGVVIKGGGTKTRSQRLVSSLLPG